MKKNEEVLCLGRLAALPAPFAASLLARPLTLQYVTHVAPHFSTALTHQLHAGGTAEALGSLG